MSNERVDQGGWSVINKRKKVRRMTTFNIDISLIRGFYQGFWS